MSAVKHAYSGFLLGGLVAIPLVLITIMAAGAGHGTYIPAKLFFPITMLSTSVFGSITVPFGLIAILQFPTIGAALGIANSTGHFRRYFVIVALAHVVLVVATFALSDKSFP